MKYSLNDLDLLSVDKIFAGLAELPYKDVAQLLQHLHGQISLQNQPPSTDAPSVRGRPGKQPNPIAKLQDVAGDADDLIK